MALAAAAITAQAAGQTVLFGVRGNGDLLRINPATGATRVVGSGGVPCDAAAAHGAEVYRNQNEHYILIAGGAGVSPDRITALDRWTGQVSWTLDTVGRPPGTVIRAMARAEFDNVLYVILGSGDPAATEVLASIDLSWGGYSVIGPTGRTDLESLTMSPSGALYALGTDGGGGLYTVNSATGALTLVGGGGFGGDDLSLAFLPDGTLRACGANLLSVDPATGATTLVGPTGFTDIRGLTVVVACYPNCVGGAFPLLNVLDFTCFINSFAAGVPYANCDDSTTPPVLNVADFMCFLNSFAAGCTAA
jgi:hypothetical protein